MRVLHVIPGIAPRYGGPSAAIAGLVTALRCSGVDAIVATTSSDGNDELEIPLGSEVDYRGMKVIFFRRDWSESYKYSRALASWLRTNVASFDLIHIHAIFSHSSIAVASACRRFRVPYIVRPLGSLYPWALAHHRWRKRVFMAAGGRQMIERAAALHYTSGDEKRFAEKRFHVQRGFITSLGVDDAMFAVDHRERPYVLFAGRLHTVKRLEWLIRAFAAARRNEWRLVIAGDGTLDYIARLKSLVRDCRIEDVVDFVGWKSSDETKVLMAQAGVAALVSSQENFGVSAAEAMAAGVPVVVTKEVGLSNDVAASNGGWVVNGEELESTLAAAMGDMEERLRRGSAARKWAEAHYRWPAVASAVMDEYRLVVAR